MGGRPAAQQAVQRPMLRERGVFKSDNKIYVSLAHDERDVAEATTAFRTAAAELLP